MSKRLLSTLLILAALCVGSAFGQETQAERDARMQWWRQAKFGLFIHWGVYSVPAGTYQGKPVPKIGEWIMKNAQIPLAEYREFAHQFNPQKYEPEQWVSLAKEAGIKYIVITAKHHDGFALYPSEVTQWDIADATPYKKDLLEPLAEAARRNGLKFGTYYSQAQDWTHPGGAKMRMKEGESWDDAQKGSFDEYLAKIAAPQVREILTRLQPDVLWWDTPEWMTPERAKPLNELLKLRPGIITNNRLGGGFKGDTETPEQHVPATGFDGRDWETCMTMNDTWGFKSYDNNWKSTETLLRNLVDVVSKGGNYLLNVGPNAQGEIPQPSVERLKEIGVWMKLNGEAIYGTSASPFKRLAWGRCTKKLTPKGGTLYLHVFDWPADGKVVLPGLHNRLSNARLLADGRSVRARRTSGQWTLELSGSAPDSKVSVIAVDFAGPLQVEPVLPGPSADGSIGLGAELADIHNSLHAHAVLEGKGPGAKVSHWQNAEGWISWDFKAKRPGTYRVMADIAGAGGGKLNLLLEQTSVASEVAVSTLAEARTVELGKVSLPKAGAYTLSLKPRAQDWKGFELQRVTLLPEAQAKSR